MGTNIWKIIWLIATFSPVSNEHINHEFEHHPSSHTKLTLDNSLKMYSLANIFGAKSKQPINPSPGSILEISYSWNVLKWLGAAIIIKSDNNNHLDTRQPS